MVEKAHSQESCHPVGGQVYEVNLTPCWCGSLSTKKQRFFNLQKKDKNLNKKARTNQCKANISYPPSRPDQTAMPPLIRNT